MADLRYVTATEAEWKAMADEIDRLRAVIEELKDDARHCAAECHPNRRIEP